MEKYKPKLTKQVAKKLAEFHSESKGKNGRLGANGKLEAYKIYMTTPYGAFRLICIDKALVDIVLVEIYPKATKDDLTNNEYKWLKELLKDCQSNEFWSNLEDL